MNRSCRLSTLVSLVLLLAWSGTLSSAGLVASVDRTRIVEGETLVLTLSAPGDSWGVPELGALDQDFDVQSQGQSTNMSIVNGQTTSTREWRLLLAAKRSGKLTIPALKIGDLESAPIPLEILPSSEAAKLGNALPVMVEAEVDGEAPYVQGQIVYTARVLLRAEVRNATLEDPKAEGLIIERLGEDSSFETYRDGQRYKVIERRYALFPQHSGPIEIAPPVLSGTIAEPRQGRGGAPTSAFERFFGRDPFADMGSLLQATRPIQIRGPAINLEVRPQPDGSASPWLPAKSLELIDSWQPDLAELRVGEPVTRTITITARGLSAAQLPDLRPEVPDGVKRYPDKPHSETRTEGEDLVAVKEIKQALVPSAAGELTLPEVRLAWWDTQANEERVAALPARVVQVLPARAGADTAPQGLPPAAPQPTASGTEPRPATSLLPAAGDRDIDGRAPSEELLEGLPFPAGYWPWLSAGLGLLWLLTLFLWLHERRRRGQRPSTPARGAETAPNLRLSKARSQVRRACESHDPKAARGALLAWAAARWPQGPPQRLESLAARLEDRAAASLRALDRSLYASGEEGWDGRATWELLNPILVQAERNPPDGATGATPLPPLYPQRT